jgi:hypothetical protein
LFGKLDELDSTLSFFLDELEIPPYIRGNRICSAPSFGGLLISAIEFGSMVPPATLSLEQAIMKIKKGR